MARFSGKRIVVTGGGAGIGAATAARFVEEGGRVLVVDIDEAGVNRVVGEIGHGVSSIVADHATEDGNRRMIERALGELGGIDAVVLNAGTEGQYGAISDLPVAAFDRVMAVNVRSVWLGLAAAMPAMRERGGSIVITSSVGGLRGTAGWAAYATSKHAVIGLAKSAALEGARFGIRVNTVNPAPTRSRMIQAIDRQMMDAGIDGVTAARTSRIPLGRYGEPGEIAAMITFLCSDEASFCTAATYLVDGGVMTG